MVEIISKDKETFKKNKKPRLAKDIDWAEWLYEAAQGNVAFDGYNVGPGWSGGYYQNSIESDIAEGPGDESGRIHDSKIAQVESHPEWTFEQKKKALEAIDQEYFEREYGQGLKRSIAGLAVKYAGPGSKKKKMPTLRGKWEQINERSKTNTDAHKDDYDARTKKAKQDLIDAGRTGKKALGNDLSGKGGNNADDLETWMLGELDSGNMTDVSFPDIGDLGSLPELPPDEEDEPMDGGTETTDAPMAEAARTAAGPGGSNPVSKETPISNFPTLTYGLQETHTTILPWTGWCSYGWLDKDSPLQIKLSMNSIWDMFPNAVFELASGGSIAAKAIHNRPVGTSGANVAGAVFPMTMTGAVTPGLSSTTERPHCRS